MEDLPFGWTHCQSQTKVGLVEIGFSEGSSTQTNEIRIDGGDHDLVIQVKLRSARQNRFGRSFQNRQSMKLTVFPDRILLTAPLRTPLKEIKAFAIENRDWLIQQKLMMAKKIKTERLGPGSKVRFYGEMRTLGFIDDSKLKASRNIYFELVGPVLLGRMSKEGLSSLRDGAEVWEPDIKKALARYAEKEARLHLSDRLRVLSSRMGLNPSKISFRKQKTRWGSCTSAGHISLNWRLVFAPEDVIDYVLIHELAHLRHQNHSKKFWDLVHQFDENMVGHRQWLKIHQEEAHIFG